MTTASKLEILCSMQMKTAVTDLSVQRIWIRYVSKKQESFAKFATMNERDTVKQL